MLNRYFHSAPASTSELALTSSSHQCDHQHQHRKNRLWPHGGGGRGTFSPPSTMINRGWTRPHQLMVDPTSLHGGRTTSLAPSLHRVYLSFKKDFTEAKAKATSNTQSKTYPTQNMNHHTLFRCPLSHTYTYILV